jgi:very-short-patch-repair endonuclease
LGNSVRWTPEQLEEYRKRSTVSTHLIVSKKETAPRAAPKESKLEIRFVQQLADAGIAGYTRNYFPILGRDWELDFAWVQTKVYIEIDGMAHRTKQRFKADFQKHAALVLDGWRGLRVCGDDVRQGRAIDWTKQLIGGQEK